MPLTMPKPISKPSSPASTASDAGYTRVAIVLHWTLALALTGMFVAGTWMVDLPFSPQRLKLYNWHKWAGITLLCLAALRLLWRLTHQPPPLPEVVVQRMLGWQRFAHYGTHLAMYALFFGVPLLGWAYSSAAGFPVVVFGWLPLPDLVAADKSLAEAIKPLHRAAAWTLCALAVLHIGAALKHQWFDRDGLMARMWPGRG